MPRIKDADRPSLDFLTTVKPVETTIASSTRRTVDDVPKAVRDLVDHAYTTRQTGKMLVIVVPSEEAGKELCRVAKAYGRLHTPEWSVGATVITRGNEFVVTLSARETSKRQTPTNAPALADSATGKTTKAKRGGREDTSPSF